ncbi:MAG: hypothetical protein HPM95_11870 [Alphaproteobacteria bacterium]|nr:hypothetical protein [Alphaproteobacteria bacterium]
MWQDQRLQVVSSFGVQFIAASKLRRIAKADLARSRWKPTSGSGLPNQFATQAGEN